MALHYEFKCVDEDSFELLLVLRDKKLNKEVLGGLFKRTIAKVSQERVDSFVLREFVMDKRFNSQVALALKSKLNRVLAKVSTNSGFKLLGVGLDRAVFVKLSESDMFEFRVFYTGTYYKK